MKYSFNLKIGTRLKENDSDTLTLTNRHSFALKTTMLGESVDAIWMGLGTFVNNIKVSDSLKNIKANIPEIKQYIESIFENKVEVNLSLKETNFYELHALSVHDGQNLGNLDGATLNIMDSNIKEG